MTAAGVRRTSRVRDISWAGSASVPQTHVDTGGVTRTVMRGAERQMAVRVAHAKAYAVSQEQLADGRPSIVFRAPAPDKVVVNHTDNERRDLLTATPEPTGTDGEWRVTLDLGSLPTPATNSTSYGVVTRPLSVRVRHQGGGWTPILAPPGDGDVAGRGGRAIRAAQTHARAPAASWS